MSDKQFTWLTCTFLVLLRLAIGWHFLFEGQEKMMTVSPVPPPPELPADTPPQPQYGSPVEHPVRPAPAKPPAKPKKAWSSEAYFREANGPLAGIFEWMGGATRLDRQDG